MEGDKLVELLDLKLHGIGLSFIHQWGQGILEGTCLRVNRQFERLAEDRESKYLSRRWVHFNGHLRRDSRVAP